MVRINLDREAMGSSWWLLPPDGRSWYSHHNQSFVSFYREAKMRFRFVAFDIFRSHLCETFTAHARLCKSVSLKPRELCRIPTTR